MAQPSTTNIILCFFSSALEKTTYANYALSLSLLQSSPSVKFLAMGTAICKILLSLNAWLEDERRPILATAFESSANLGCGALLGLVLTEPEIINPILPPNIKPLSMTFVITSMASLILALKNIIAAYKLNSTENTDQTRTEFYKSIAFFTAEGLIFSGMLCLMEDIIPSGYTLLGLGLLTAITTGIFFYKSWSNLWRQPIASPPVAPVEILSPYSAGTSPDDEEILSPLRDESLNNNDEPPTPRSIQPSSSIDSLP